MLSIVTLIKMALLTAEADDFKGVEYIEFTILNRFRSAEHMTENLFGALQYPDIFNLPPPEIA